MVSFDIHNQGLSQIFLVWLVIHLLYFPTSSSLLVLEMCALIHHGWAPPRRQNNAMFLSEYWRVHYKIKIKNHAKKKKLR